MANMEWCEEQLSKLSNEDTRLPVLKEMKDFLSAISHEEMMRTADSLQLPPVFDCLNNSNSEQVDLACDVLSLCMSNLNIGESTNRYGVFIERALKHPFPAVKVMALNEIKRNIENEDILIDLCKRESLLTNIIKCVADTEITVGKKAAEVIKIVGLSSFGIKKLTTTDILKVIHEIMAKNEIVKFRIFDITIGISVHSEQNFSTLRGTGLITDLSAELTNSDVLIRLNVLELLSQLGRCKHGFAYLESIDMLKRLAAMLEGDDLLTIQMCEPGILKFFGNMAHWKPMEVLSKHPNMFQKLFDNLDSDDFTVMGVTLDTFGHIALPNEGKIALDSTGLGVETAIRNVCRSIPTLPTEIKVRGLNCIEYFLRVVDYNNQISSITQKWFRLIDESPMVYIWNYAKNPFFEMRFAAFGIVNAIAAQGWGQEEIRNTPGFLEFLLDRSIESIKDCKDAKYEIIELLAKSPCFDEGSLKKLNGYLREGPFYVHTVTEVATEGNE